MAAPVLVIGAVVSVQLGSATATTLFDQVGPAGAVLYRLMTAAIILIAIWRPRPLEAGRDGLVLAVAFGVALAGMNLCFYESLDRIPLGDVTVLQSGVNDGDAVVVNGHLQLTNGARVAVRAAKKAGS